MPSPGQSSEPEPVFVSEYGFIYNPNKEKPEPVPECSIEGVKPIIEQVPIAEIEAQKALKARIKNGA